MNERHYGSLTGLNKEETKKTIGEEQFKKYRRSWDIPPPPMAENDKNHSLFSPLNPSIPVGMIPFTESLKDTYKRVIPYYEKEIQKNIKENKNVLISAHGNSLRSLCKYLFKISDQKINELEIPTGNPLIIEFDNNLEIEKYYYLDETRAKTIIFNQYYLNLIICRTFFLYLSDKTFAYSHFQLKNFSQLNSPKSCS